MFFTRFLLTAVTLAATAPAAWADVTLSAIFTENMVLQQRMPVPIFGWAAPGERVTVTFAGNSAEAVAAADGRWLVRLPEMEACAEGRELTVAGTNTLTLANVVVGEVWLCSGQSNMECPLHSSDIPADDARDEPLIRYARLWREDYVEPPLDVRLDSRTWMPYTGEAFRHGTAVGYFFAKRLREELDVPVGLIDSSRGASNINSWIPREGFIGLEEVPELADEYAHSQRSLREYRQRMLEYAQVVGPWAEAAKRAHAAGEPLPMCPRVQHFSNAGAMFYGSVAPIIPYAVRGLLWYQGESNAQDREAYYFKQKAMINGWRRLWNQPGDAHDFPFYFVQLANYEAATDDPAQEQHWSKIRDAQTQSLDIKNSGMAVIIDVGDAKDIHPRNKYDVGHRLAAWALAKDYGKHGEYTGPLYESMRVDGDKIRLKFTHTGSGLMVGVKDGMLPVAADATGRLKRFSIAGEDRKWHWADAVIDGDEVVVTCPAVPRPVAVRYAWSNNPAGCNLYNREGFPAVPFRTDAW